MIEPQHLDGRQQLPCMTNEQLRQLEVGARDELYRRYVLYCAATDALDYLRDRIEPGYERLVETLGSAIEAATQDFAKYPEDDDPEEVQP